ncbi:OB-fold nucleic acid binding domain-containing protein [Glycomyces sp. L485]|uniref:OB-fold nucleic acid binding domain-containing protein n=1 Tax=Glycomyces sp. L485 TaxID=2909235 RepID=UPI001F4B781E|nr:OB-fold nucleic acid binding domain-containing protein [Glycomyces sp. L485]MCH7232643.1 OB-fold nucleic acid binding domain-containing protein [Glycomyces sp. L485]
MSGRENAEPGWKLWMRRLAVPSQELFAENVRRETDTDYTPVDRLEARRPAAVAGRLRTVVLRTEGRSPSVEAELFDGTGQVGLVWMGRRRIVGLEAGTRIVARGRVAQGSDGRFVIYNPIYELRP